MLTPLMDAGSAAVLALIDVVLLVVCDAAVPEALVALPGAELPFALAGGTPPDAMVLEVGIEDSFGVVRADETWELNETLAVADW